MEFQESRHIKSLKEVLDVSIDKILNGYSDLEETVLSESDIKEIVENISTSKEILQITEKFCDDYDFYDYDKYSFVLNLEKSETPEDEITCDHLIQMLIENPTTEMKCKILKLIHRFPITDMIDKENWIKLSKLLREYLICKNQELFLTSFKIHMKLSTNSQTINFAFSNLIKALKSVFQSKRSQILYFDGINMKIPQQENLVRLIDLTVKNLICIHKYHNNYKEKSMESTVYNFLELISFHVYCDKNDTLNVFSYLSILDPTAKWLSQLLYSTCSRNITIRFLRENPLFIKFLICEIIHTINVTENDVKLKQSPKPELTVEVIKFAVFSQCANITFHLSCCRKGRELFYSDLKINDRHVTLNSLILSIITAINNLSDIPNQKQKRNILTDVTTKVLQHNHHLICDKDILHTLLKQLYFNISAKTNILQVTKNNIHIFRVFSSVAKNEDGFFVIFGFAERQRSRRIQNKYNRSISLTEPALFSTLIDKYMKHHCVYSAKEKDFICPGKLLIEFSANFLISCMNTQNIEDFIGDIIEILNCCCCIFTIHSYVTNLVNTKKLLSAVKELGLITLEKHLLNVTRETLKLLCIIGNTSNGSEYLKQDFETFYSICKSYSTSSAGILKDTELSSLFLKLATDDTLYQAVLENNRQCITGILQQIWKLETDEVIFLSGSDALLGSKTSDLERIIFILSLNCECIKQILANETEDDVTLIEDDGKPVTLQELLDECLTTSQSQTSCYLGLLVIRILMYNLDTYLILQQKHNLQNHFSTLQSECVISVSEGTDQDSEIIIIDECSTIREEIIEYIYSIGNVSFKYKEGIKSRHLQSSATYSARIRHRNELHRFLNESRNNLHDNGWIIQARRVYRFVCAENLKEYVLVDLIQQVKASVPNLKLNFIWPTNDRSLDNLFPEDIIGISVTVRFGVQNRLLPSTSQNEENLNLLLRQVYFYLNINREKFDHFDWFVSVIFLICGGNMERCRTTLQCIVHLPASSFIWTSLGSKIKYRGKSGILTHFENVLGVLIDDFEILKSALQAAKISWTALSKVWINQCFFNVFQWSEIIHYLAVCVLYPAEYVLFVLLSIAQHLHFIILRASVKQEHDFYQKMMQLEGFKISDWLPHIEQMAKQYKNMLMKF